ncbi:BamA/TamA family outer membrane protein [Psychroflexus sp. YR1-1]|uniref:BamA/TamA family outer membrane protein n=1 Tax=Psychroflexus aurantiacus TaxID=2709310 RepID=A0A6B3R024_9FLAO|nr:BamA/TamA family outer membrane protein [Psychroflexus aurantiacus]NEV93398.1 BamA/TamA family outer membrane protein [Psychroflexus aurantiacus]
MNYGLTKLPLILLIAFLFFSCDVTRKLSENDYLITEQSITSNDTLVTKTEIYNQLSQQTNTKLLGFPLKLQIYNLAQTKPEERFISWVGKRKQRADRLTSLLSKRQVIQLKKFWINVNTSIKKTGEPPTLFDREKTESSLGKLESWYWNHGWFNADADFSIQKDSVNQTVKIDYKVNPGVLYVIDSISENIESAAVDSLYQRIKKDNRVKVGKPYNTDAFNSDRDFMSGYFRNHGLYHFEKEYISFYADTLGNDQKINLELNISNRRVDLQDTLASIPFKIHRISQVNVFPDYDGTTRKVEDSARYNSTNIYSFGDLKLNPKVLSNFIFIKKDSLYRDIDRARTNNRISETRIFKYPNILYQEDPRDSTGNGLIANIFLTPKERFSTNFSVDVSQSNIQQFGIGFNTSVLARNIFRGAETLELSGRGNFGSSRDLSTSNDQFLDILEYGADLRLNFPRIIFPFSVQSIIKNTMSPFTSASVGFSTQQNIGLDRRNLNAVFGYRWKPKDRTSYQLDLMNIQFVNNLNAANFFNVFRNSYSELNQISRNNIDQVNPEFLFENNEGELDLIIPTGTAGFIRDINTQTINLSGEEQQTASSLIERRERLTENNLIVASNFSYDFSTRRDIYDQNFSQFRGKIELAGNILSLLAGPLNLEQTPEGNYRLFDVQFSQYVKTELNYIKYWDLGGQQVVAARAYGGIAIPYGNANSIPFPRSFFGGGPNDNRGWRPYDLGPGSTNAVNDFNEANFKLSFNAEYRFNLFGSLNSALFIDAGNIWNVFDNIDNPAATFDGLQDLSELSIASGFGLRYDIDFFVIRMDLGFKTYNPGNEGTKWFKNYNFSNAVFNFGINYPF